MLSTVKGKNMPKSKLSLLFIILLNSSALCADDKDLWATIFIHGTIKSHLSMRNIATIWQGNVSKSAYATISRYFREHPIFKTQQAMQGIGLQRITFNDVINGSGAAATAHVVDYFTKQLRPNEKNFYYTFGWSGLLSATTRKKAASKLYHKLVQLKEQACRQDKNLRLRIIAFSHGGNVALNLANLENEYKRGLAINELILLAMPVQQDTDFLVTHPMFCGWIYHLYSFNDLVQGLDHISSNYFTCHHKFTPRRDFCLPDNLVQVEVSVTNVIETACVYRRTKQQGKMPVQTYHINPGHSEFWTFGWAPRGYRNYFPLYPQPIVVFVPHLVHAAQQAVNKGHRDLTLDIKPARELITIIANKYCYNMPFVKQERLQHMRKKLSNLFAPYYYTLADYRQLIKNGLRETFCQHNCCWK